MSARHGPRARAFRRSALALPAISILAVPLAVAGQSSVSFRSAALFEDYELSRSLASSVDQVSEISVPIAVTARFGRRTVVTLATGYARVRASDGGQELSSVSGVLDTEVRVAIQAVPDRVTLFATSAFPTGIGSLAQDQLPLVGMLASDVIGFSSANLGGGGTVGGGLALSAPAGRMALGAAASFEASGTYQPIETPSSGAPNDFRPGQELRLRIGLEGPIARRTFLRASGIFAHRGDDEANGEIVPSVGNRISGYVSLDQGVGSSSLSIYLFDLFRSAAGVELTQFGPSVLQRGNVFALGAQWSILLSTGTYIVPRFEMRDSRSEAEGATGLQRLGRTSRFGADFRRRLGPAATVAVRGDRLTGSVLDVVNDADLDVTGYRFGVQLEITP